MPESLWRILESEGPASRHHPAPVADEPPLDATMNQRLNALERKVAGLLGENEDRSSSAKILERLDALDHELDQLISAQKKTVP
jgi:hypothetical protein